jgi:WD40 repeat protein
LEIQYFSAHKSSEIVARLLLLLFRLSQNSGALDYKVKLWDFGGMDQRHKAFKEIEPQAGYAVLALSFSPTGDRFLAATSSVQPAVFDKEGRELLRFVRGDMYLADSANTKGHTHPVTGAAWNPSASDQVLSCSSDGTLRTWDLNGPTALEDRLVCKQVFKLKDARGKRVGATACAHDPDGCDYIVGGAADGSIHFWAPNKGSAARPDLIRSAHSGGVTSVVFSPSGRQLASRGDDSCVRVWDVRKKSEPLQVFPDLESFFETSNVAWSPSGRHLVAGTSVRKGAGTGALKFFGLESPAPVLELGIAPGASVVQVCWHSKLNQVLASTSAGPLRLFYDPLLSRHGALLTASRTPRRKDPMDYIPVAPQAVGVIINPHALPMFRDPSQKRPRRGEEDLKPGELRRPGKPVNGPGSQTESVSRARHHFTEMFMEGRLKTSNLRDQDSRVELLKYAGREKPGERVLAETTMEQDKEDAESAAKKARGR